MKEEALAIAGQTDDPAQRLNVLREYVQAFVLRSLSEREAFRCLTFVGGTALRFLFGLPRFSEDLDFSLETPEGYAPRVWLAGLKRDLILAGFDVSLRWNDRQIVHSAWIRIPELLNEAGLAAMPNQNLSVKVEIDTRPPTGGVSVRTVVTRYVSFAVQHHDLPSLMAGKLHALLTRRYVKGRDWYDLLWYRSRRPPVVPNVHLLRNALRQTEGAAAFDPAAWTEVLLRELGALDMNAIREEVRPLLERPADAQLLTRDHLETLLKQAS